MSLLGIDIGTTGQRPYARNECDDAGLTRKVHGDASLFVGRQVQYNCCPKCERERRANVCAY